MLQRGTRTAACGAAAAGCLAAALLAGEAARGQERYVPNIPNVKNEQDLVPVDPGRGDVGPLSDSLRVIPLDLRQPTGFQHVYQVPGSEDELMRVSGALIAVFPRSVYTAGRGGGQVPVIPPGTVFYIGGIEPFPRAVGPTGNRAVAVPDDPFGLRMATRKGEKWLALESGTEGVRGGTIEVVQGGRVERATGQAEPREERRADEQPTIANDEEFRVKRIRELMEAAAEGEREKQGTGGE